MLQIIAGCSDALYLAVHTFLFSQLGGMLDTVSLRTFSCGWRVQSQLGKETALRLLCHDPTPAMYRKLYKLLLATTPALNQPVVPVSIIWVLFGLFGLITFYSVSQKNPPKVFWQFFSKRLGIFSPNFTHLLLVPIFAGHQIFITLSPTITKLCYIKCDHPACVSADGGHFEHIMVIALNMS